MGFTTLVLLGFIILIIGAAAAIAAKQYILGVVFLALIVLAVFALGYLWITSPM